MMTKQARHTSRAAPHKDYEARMSENTSWKGREDCETPGGRAGRRYNGMNISSF